jgi:hypothetical protein
MKALLLALALVAGSDTAPSALLSLPGTIKGSPGSFIVIKAETNCKSVRFVIIDEGLNLLPAEELADKTHAVVSGPTGTYRVLAYGALGDAVTDPVVVTVVIGAAVAKSEPRQTLAEQVQAAYAADQDGDKTASVAFMAEVYKQMATAIQKPTIKTSTDARKTLDKALSDLPASKVAKVQALIAAEEDRHYPAQPVTLTQADRDLLARAFAQTSELLGGLK